MPDVITVINSDPDGRATTIELSHAKMFRNDVNSKWQIDDANFPPTNR